jgi:hypothetical protein
MSKIEIPEEFAEIYNGDGDTYFVRDDLFFDSKMVLAYSDYRMKAELKALIEELDNQKIEKDERDEGRNFGLQIAIEILKSRI